MRQLVMIRGNSGSGKSSVAKALQQQVGRNTMLISQDTVRREMLWVRDGVNTKAIPLLVALLEYGYNNSETTIVEGILASAWYRPLFNNAIELFHEENIHAYYYDLSFDETVKRHETRKNLVNFDANDMRGWWIEKDYIGFIEEKGIHEDVTLTDAVNMIMSDLKLH